MFTIYLTNFDFKNGLSGVFLKNKKNLNSKYTVFCANKKKTLRMFAPALFTLYDT